MYSGVIVGQLCLHGCAFRIDHCGEVIHIRNLVLMGILPDAVVEVANLAHAVADAWAPAKAACGQTAGQDDLAFVVACQLNHREDIAISQVFVVFAGVLCDVVCAVVDDNDLGLEVDDIFAEAEEELV